MIYSFNNRQKLSKAIAQFQAKYPTGTVERFDQDRFMLQHAEFEGLLSAEEDLFGDKHLIVLDGVTEVSEEEEGIIKASTAKVLWYQPEARKSFEFNLFALADALAARDRGQAWLVYQQALRSGVTPEEIYWRSLVWKTKKLLQLGSQKYSDSELGALSSRLVRVWHDTKREVGRDFGLELEHLLLTL